MEYVPRYSWWYQLPPASLLASAHEFETGGYCTETQVLIKLDELIFYDGELLTVLSEDFTLEDILKVVTL